MMRLKAADLIGSQIRATDGDAGTVCDILFDDQSLAVKWIVVCTGSWLSEEQVLVMPQHLLRSEADPRIWEARLTIEGFRKARPLEDDLPVSLQRLREAKVGSGVLPFRIAPLGMPPVVRLQSVVTGDQHLRSARNVTGYIVIAEDEEVQQVADFIVALPQWTISAIEISSADNLRTQVQDVKKPLRVDADHRVVHLADMAGEVSSLDDQGAYQSAKAGRRPFGH